MKKTILIGLILGAVSFVTASSCFAQVINGCVNKNGQISILTPPDQCKKNETPISWNGTGAPGLPGPQGPAGVANGIRAAVWGEYIINGQNADNCSVPFFRGADNVIGLSTGNDGECRLTFTLPAGQSQSWGTSYACFTSIVSGNATPYGTTCQNTNDMDGSGKPDPIFQCLNSSGPPTFAQINFLCIAP
jgi:hypothetical protein